MRRHRAPTAIRAIRVLRARRSSARRRPVSATRSRATRSAPDGWHCAASRRRRWIAGAHGELQAAVITVTGVDPPVAAGLAGRDSAQFTLSAFAVLVASAIGAAARAPAMVARPNVLRMFFTSFLSPSARLQHPRGRAGAAACYTDGRVGSRRLGQTRQGRPEVPLRTSGPAAAEGDPASRSPTHTQVVGFEIICFF